VIVFSIVFITLLAHETEFLGTKKRKRLGAQILEKHSMDQKKINVIQQIRANLAKKVASQICGEFKEMPDGWSITFKPLPDFSITYEVTSNDVQILYDVNKAQWIPGVVYAFKWLYANAIIRTARKLGEDTLPQISFSNLI
jgi:hypothetical protein